MAKITIHDTSSHKFHESYDFLTLIRGEYMVWIRYGKIYKKLTRKLIKSLQPDVEWGEEQEGWREYLMKNILIQYEV